MPDNSTLEHFSLLDELPSLTPVWRPFVQQPPNDCAAEQQPQ